MSELIVNCAGCGKRYRGIPGKSYKCSACANLFTIPAEPKTAAEGKIFCSNCWREFNSKELREECPECGENITVAHGGGKASAAPAKSSGLSASVKVEETEKQGQDLKAQVAELTAKLAATAHERDEALAKAELEFFERTEAQAKLEQFREAAVSSLEPLGLEYTRRMRELISDTETLRRQARQVRDDTQKRLDSIERACGELKDKLNCVCSEINEQLSEVLGVPNHVIDTEDGEGLDMLAQPPEQLVQPVQVTQAIAV